MNQINWGVIQGGGFQNAFAQGLQEGNMVRQRQEQREERNALAAYAKDPSEQNFSGLADVRPDIAIQQREQMQKQQAQQREGQLVQSAIAGDEGALNELATLNFDKWKSLSGEQRTAAKQQSEAYANAALDVLNKPAGQRAQAIMGYAQQFQSEEIAQIAQLPPDQQEAALRAAVAEGQMMERLIRMERPDYMAIPEGGTLVDTNNPQAIAQFGAEQGGQPVQIGTAQDYEALAPGARYIDPNGNVRVKGGASSNASGGFPGN